MTRRRGLAWAGATAALALAGGAALRHWIERPDTATDTAVEQLFSASYEDADGRLQPLAQWRGRLLVLNFWATWCAPCVEEMPELQAVQDAFASRHVTIVGLAIDSASKVRRFRDDLKLRLPLLVAGAGGSELARSLGNPSGALPYTVLIAPSGKLVHRKLGRIREAELASWLRQS
jgi:peroxiredoxin